MSASRVISVKKAADVARTGASEEKTHFDAQVNAKANAEIQRVTLIAKGDTLSRARDEVLSGGGGWNPWGGENHFDTDAELSAYQQGITAAVGIIDGIDPSTIVTQQQEISVSLDPLDPPVDWEALMTAAAFQQPARSADSQARAVAAKVEKEKAIATEKADIAASFHQTGEGNWFQKKIDAARARCLKFGFTGGLKTGHLTITSLDQSREDAEKRDQREREAVARRKAARERKRQRERDKRRKK